MKGWNLNVSGVVADLKLYPLKTKSSANPNVKMSGGLRICLAKIIHVGKVGTKNTTDPIGKNRDDAPVNATATSVRLAECRKRNIEKSMLAT
jgi:hypothetical protein